MAETNTLPVETTVALLVSRGRPDTARGTITMPEVRGRTIGAAVDRIERMGVTVHVSLNHSARVPAHRTYAQYPEPGKQVLRGSTVLILVSRGRPAGGWAGMTILPDEVGHTSFDAEDTLRHNGLNPAIVETIHETVPAGTVIAQLPNRQSISSEPNLWLVRLRPLVSLVVLAAAVMWFGWYFLGGSPLPNVVGMQFGDAQQKLILAGFGVASVTSTRAPNTPDGQVLAQVPAAGAPERRGTRVMLVVVGGQPGVMVPELVGLSALQVNLALQAQSLGLIKRSVPSTSVPRGFVVQQSPPGGTLVNPGSKVTITYSSGSQK